MKRIILLLKSLWNIIFEFSNVILMKTSRKVLINNLLNKNYQIKSDLEHLDNAIFWLVHAQDISEGRGVSGGYSQIRGWSCHTREKILQQQLVFRPHDPGALSRGWAEAV